MNANANGIRVVLAVLMAVLMVGCGGSFEVPSAHVGKMIDSNGFSPEIINPGRERFAMPDFGGGREIVLLSTATQTPTENMTMKLADDLTLKFGIRARLSVKRTPDVLNSVFDTLQPQTVNYDGRAMRVITFGQLYGTYGQMEIQEQARRIVSQYNIGDIQENYGRISGEVFESVRQAISGTPLQVESLTMVNIDYPEVVDRSIEAVKQRDLAILEEEAKVQQDLVKVQGALKIANAQREVDLTMARTQRDANQIIGEGVTAEFLALKQLEAQTAMAANGNAVFMPFEALNTVGAQTRMFSTK